MERIDALLMDVVVSVGEELAMLLPLMPREDEAGSASDLPEEGPGPASGTPEVVRMRVGFQGPWAGEVLVACGGSLPQALAANMLGAEENPDAELVRDACAEFSNVVCGNLLPRLAGSGPVFSLTAPQEAGSMMFSPGYSACGRARVDFDEGPVEVALGLDAAAIEALGEAGIPPP